MNNPGYSPLWQRGVRGDFINHKYFYIFSNTDLIFSKISLSENHITMNKFNREKQKQIIASLIEGNSIRAMCRITDTAKGTVLRDLWMATNPLTGYFLENNSMDCQHGFFLPVDFTQGWTCIKQFFRCSPQCMPVDWRDCR
jgi:hypothetical protein